ARARNCSSVQRVRDTPTTGRFSRPCRVSAHSAGKIFLNARSPLAPKNTNPSERWAPISISLEGRDGRRSWAVAARPIAVHIGRQGTDPRPAPLVPAKAQQRSIGRAHTQGD